VADVESFVLIDGHGRAIRCSREENIDRFGWPSAATVYSASSLRSRSDSYHGASCACCRVQQIDDIITRFDDRIRNGFTYGDFQFAIDPQSDDFLRRGVFSCYQPLPESAAVPNGQKELSGDDWNKLLVLAHTSKTEAFERYAAYYLSTMARFTGRISSNSAITSAAITHYSIGDARAGSDRNYHEVYVPRPQLAALMHDLADDFRATT